MYYRTGLELETAIFKCCSSGNELVDRLISRPANFSRDLTAFLIKRTQIKYPDTLIGKSLYWLVKRELVRLGINDEGFVFLSTIDTMADLHHFTDGFFFLPECKKHPVTVDAFNLSPKRFLELKGLWFDLFSGEFYSQADVQNDLFQYKSGLQAWRKSGRQMPSDEVPLKDLPDFRQFAKYGRPENHFVLTPHHVQKIRQRKEFAWLVAEYFDKVLNQPKHQKPDLRGA